MKRKAILLTGACALAVLPLAFSFEQSQGTQTGPSLKQLFPGVYGSANFGKVLAGEFTGNLVLDALVMDGTTLYMTSAPVSFDNRNTVSTAVNDFAVLSGVLAGKDLVVTVSVNGLRTHVRDSAAGSWTATTIRGPETAWLNASKVCTGDLNGDGNTDLVGVAANGRDLLFEYGSGTGTFTSGTTVTLPNTTIIREILTLNYVESGDVPGDDEVAVSTEDGAAVYNVTNGTYPLGVNWTSSVLRNAAIKRNGSVTERLASVAFFSGQDRLVVRGTGGVVEPTVNLGNLGVVGLSSGDADNDGDSELFLSCNTDRKFRMALNASPATSTFSAGTVTSFESGNSQRDPALNDSNLALGDFDSDGYIDVLAPAQGGGSNPSFVHGTLEIVQLGIGNPAQYKPDVLEVMYFDYAEGLIPDRVRWTFNRPLAVLTPPAGGQVVFRVQVFLSVDSGTTTATAPIEDRYLTIPAAGSSVLFAMDCPANFDPTSNDPRVLTLILRQEVLDSAGNPVDVAPAMLGLLSSEVTGIPIRIAPETHAFVIADRADSSIPPSGGFDIGPQTPPFDDELEPKDDEKPPEG